MKLDSFLLPRLTSTFWTETFLRPLIIYVYVHALPCSGSLVCSIYTHSAHTQIRDNLWVLVLGFQGLTNTLSAENFSCSLLFSDSCSLGWPETWISLYPFPSWLLELLDMYHHIWLYLFYLRFIYFYVYVCFIFACMYVCIPYVCPVSLRPEESVKSLRIVVTVDRELPCGYWTFNPVPLQFMYLNDTIHWLSESL